MAPRKKTEDKEKPAPKATGDEAADMILNYLRECSLRSDAIDISANLHNAVTKAAAAKILKDLHERNEIEGRAAGKQIVYHAIQNPEDSITLEALAALEAKTTDLRTRTAVLQSTAKTLRATLATLNSTLSTADLVAGVTAMETEKAEIQGRLESLRAGKAKKVTKRERDEVESAWEKWGKMARKRQKLSKEMWEYVDACLDDAGQDREQKAEVRESLGLDE
ncbi:hypothetical protein PSPO01_00663 [Paraphaeosphaeria sporulosa]